MTSVEKRRSGRKSGGHRKHSDGGYSDTSSGGSYLDETDREVSNLTDRAFRSLCIGDEAVYNDSDLCSSSPCTQRDRQLAFSQSGQDRDREELGREELKRSAHESFSLRMQQYGQDRVQGGIYEAEIQRDPQWDVYGERTQGRVSSTFQHSFVETSQREEPLGEEQSSFLSNGATELSSQQRRSRSRVSSLIRAFNSEGQRDGAGMDGKLREYNDETSWDKSALMSIQSELSEFSTSYQQNFNSGHFPSAGSFSSQNNNFYSSAVASVAHMNSASSFLRSSHTQHSMSDQFSCNSNFFIHSEFSPFKVWRDHNRFPFQQAEVSGFMHCSEFPKWYDTPMYRELSLDAQPQGPYRFDERGIRHPRNNLAPVVPPTPPRATSTSTILQKSSAVEKRCESELTGHYPHRTRTQSLGTKRFPLQRSSTASPTSEMSRRVQDTISSVKALQQKIKMMTEQNIATGMTANQQGDSSSNNNCIPFNNNAKIVAPNTVSSNTSTTPFNISQLLTPLVHAHQEAETLEVGQSSVSPELKEHPPVRAESRGATPDVRMSSYKSRATSLLFNLKDNRKRVKSTYSPAKFKGLETLEKNKQYSTQEPRDTVIDIPDFPDPDFQLLQEEESSRTNDTSHQFVNQYNSPGRFTTPNSQHAHSGLYSEYTSSDYRTAPSLPRSNTSSPALGAKPLMFRVKDNTIRGSSFTKSVKPRLHKNFGKDFRVGSPMERGSEREEDEQQIMRRSAGTPVYPDTGLNRLAAIKESSTFQPAYSSQDNYAPLPQHKPYSRWSVALDEDDTRSVISNMSEGGESFATSTTDLADIRALYDNERPESACSFSSDVSRSLGKPPSVPPKSEKALRRAQRLTTRRIKKELSKTAADSHAVPSIPSSSSSTEVRSYSRQAMASPHFSSPVSLAHAPTLGSSFPSSHPEHQSSHSSFYASPHATGPISLPVASRHAIAPVSLPDASPQATGPASHTAAPKTVAHVSSSPTPHHANHQAPVAQYHVESSYPHSYPLTQRKVLQDLGSGQYFVVDVPVQVKTKTFFDPETGKYVQLNVRQSGQSTARPQPQQTYLQPQLQPQMQVNLQQQPQASPASKPFVLYQGNHGYPQDYQPPGITSVPCHRSSAPLTLNQDQQPVGESHGYGYPAHQMGQKSEGHRYSPEKTPYMDTVNDKDKTYNTVNNTHGPYERFSESDTDSQLAGSSICENDNSAPSQCQPLDIITMGELEDFMEVSDW
ncbi:cardiac-enriched FHL2-interacting protein [Anoplopoma fimbria]|uniref:cardiac-enriched FHL2-interacting protein n=1 Tax=Anoplopoma fimbria TaxID=229290 RepID=UPI0023ED4ECD|nr:cardiac-enriched FHL2-interacting protein [Anoplopoma fimbria]